MFASTFRNTIKTLLRSKTFWLSMSVFTLLVFWDVRQGIVSDNIKLDIPLPIMFELAQMIHNMVVFGMMQYAFPIFTVITISLVQERDFGDQFFEIEKSMNIKPMRYLAGRICAITTVNLTAFTLLGVARLNTNILMLGGFRDMPIGKYLFTSTYYLLRLIFMFTLPSLLYYIGIIYLIGMLFKSGKAAAYGGFGHVMILYIYYNYLWRTFFPIYYQSFSPIAEHLSVYSSYWGVEGAEKPLAFYGTKPVNALVSALFLVGVYVLGMLISFILTKRREV